MTPEELRAQYLKDLEAIAHASLNVVASGQDEFGDYKVDQVSMGALSLAVRRFANRHMKARSKKRGAK
jgi:hypothetical protein